MRNDIKIAALLGVIAVSNVSIAAPVYAVENKNLNNPIESRNSVENQIIYLRDGEGDINSGNGSRDNPYNNIRTALKNIKDGQVLKLVDTVQYTKYEQHSDGSALPLKIDKNITIEGVDSNSSLNLRAPIQLEADVTFKDMKLEMVTEVILGKSADDKESRMLGQVNSLGSTIYVAGHELTLDNVDTKLGENAAQSDLRPFISGGAYKDSNDLGKKSIINIKNPNGETKFSGIFAGDYWEDRNMDVEINIDGKYGEVIDKKIHTGGIIGKLNGNVVVNFSNKSLINDITMNINNVNNLILEKNSRITLPQNGEFEAENVTLNKGSVIDFRYMNSDPTINGNFAGVDNISDPQEGGGVILDTDQTLHINGRVSGLTRLNSNGVENMKVFKDGHNYIIADKDSTGEFSIDGSQYTTKYELNKSYNENSVLWTIESISSLDNFGSFKLLDGDYKIINPSFRSEYSYKFELFDSDGNKYKPTQIDLFSNFSCSVELANGEIIDDSSSEEDMDLEIMFNDEKAGSELDEPNQVDIVVNNPDNIIGKMTLTIMHIGTGEKISKTIYVMKEQEELSGTIEIIGEAVSGGTLRADTSKLQQDAENLKYTWYVGDAIKKVSEDSEFEIKEEYIGKRVKVKVEAGNYDGAVFSDEIIVKENSGGGSTPDKPEENPGGENKPDKPEENPGGENKPDKPEENPGGENKPDKPEENPGGGSTPGNPEENPGGGSTPDKPEENPGGESTPDKPEQNPEEEEKPGNNTVDKEELISYYNKCVDRDYNKNKFTKTTFTAYEKALRKAKDIINDNNSKQEEVDSALKNLKKAVSGLKKKSTSSSGSSGSSSSKNNNNSSSSNDENSSSSKNESLSSNINKEDVSSAGNSSSITESMPQTSNQGTTWDKQGENWKVISSDGDYVKGWHKDENAGKWYMLDRNTGDMITGWYKDEDSKWYYLDTNSGSMVTGWHKDTDGKWYHLSNSGNMNTGWYKDTNGKWYHLSDSGSMNTGWYKDIDGKWYYLNSDGSMAINTIIDGYKIDNDGVWRG
ncbi:hypothetical protein [uncultured Clostridium sp.]|uniref:hypothetical protein n=1 Tax=uncultured Clostridium sp. TaxID=59620 RepID=UPI0025FA248E|nr:hypothetical protein [uncultured Clostridium sp.]